MNSFNFGGQNADPEIVRENFNKIARYLTAADACVLSLQSQSADISALGANAAIRTFTVFMRSDTDVCDVTIPDPAIFDYLTIGKKDTLFFFKGLSGASTKTIIANSGTIEGAGSMTLANDQTICIQSDGTEYKILFDSTAMTGGSGDTADRFGLEDVTTPSDRTVDMGSKNLVLNNTALYRIFDDVPNLLLSITPTFSKISTTDGTAISSISLFSGGLQSVLISASDGTNTVTGRFNAAENSVRFTAAFTVLQSGFVVPYIAANADYSILETDYTIECFDLAGPNSFTVTLPDFPSIGGQIYVIKNSGTGTITVAATGAQVIDGASTVSLSTQYSSITVQAGNSDSWAIIAKV